MSRTRFALVGCGRIAERHLDALAQHRDRAELVAVCDTDPTLLARTAERFGCAAYAGLDPLLAAGDAEVVILATPSGLHAPQAIAAAAAGCHVITEKPMATRLADGLAMVEAARKHGVRLFVVKQNRYNAPIVQLKQAIDQGRFGRIFQITSNVFWTRPQSYYDQAPWRGTRTLDGGAFMNQASHYVDLLAWLFGPVESVQCYTATQARRIEMEDSGVLALRWASGALGSLNVSMLTYPANLEGSLTVLGERGTVRIGGTAVNAIERWQFADAQPGDEAIGDSSYATDSVYGFGHVRYYRNVLDTLAGAGEAEVGGDEGLKSLELLEAAYRAAATGQRVTLPLAP
ncbi:Gfo/Idh/MocA family protein [Chitinimonas koreensis]|uniref:Gfo/Idh/MocA family protein n=1 Tax=Chitinimonas koreensis TaxID=356302 RepID=UPI00041EEB42|nr:Gfo/Idh/MocA family oxidoreductase [Chitinimonas koreensis]